MFRKLLFFSLLAGSVASCDTETYQGGGRLYKTQCANCHMDNGEGLSALIPPLGNSDYLAKNRDRLPCIVRYGLHDTIVVNGKTYAENMPGMPGNSEIQVTNILNYINSSWGNNNPPYSFDEVRQLLEKCH